MQQLHTSKMIQKEFIEFLELGKEEVLETQFEMQKRREKLLKALVLGNIDKHKVKIFFQDTMGLKHVETTVWGVTDKRIILKGGIVIPINRVVFIKLL